MKKSLILIALLFGGLTFSQAQKYGYINLGNLMSVMPEVEKANTDLEAFQEELVQKGEQMAADLQEAYGKFVSEVQEGTVPPKDQQTRQAQLQKQQQNIMAYEQEVIQKVQAKREELLGPILEKAQVAIAEVAKENGFNMIFDSSTFNTILFAEESVDIMPLVAAKLGVKIPEE